MFLNKSSNDIVFEFLFPRVVFFEVVFDVFFGAFDVVLADDVFCTTDVLFPEVFPRDDELFTPDVLLVVLFPPLFFDPFLKKKKYTRPRITTANPTAIAILVLVQNGSSSSGSIGIIVIGGIGARVGGSVIGSSVGAGVVVIGFRASRFPDPSKRSGLTGRGKTTFPSP